MIEFGRVLKVVDLEERWRQEAQRAQAIHTLEEEKAAWLEAIDDGSLPLTLTLTLNLTLTLTLTRMVGNDGPLPQSSPPRKEEAFAPVGPAPPRQAPQAATDRQKPIPHHWEARLVWLRQSPSREGHHWPPHGPALFPGLAPAQPSAIATGRISAGAIRATGHAP